VGCGAHPAPGHLPRRAFWFMPSTLPRGQFAWRPQSTIGAKKGNSANGTWLKPWLAGDIGTPRQRKRARVAMTRARC